MRFDGAGSLLIPMGQYNIEQTAKFYDNLDGRLGHPNVAICKNLTHCPLGNTIWAQAMVRFSDSMINDYVLECSLQLSDACDNSGAVQALQANSGSNTTADKTLDCKSGSTINCTASYFTGFCVGVGNPSGCPTSHVGAPVYIYGGTNCAQGPYTIASVSTYYEVVLNASPSILGQQCVNAHIFVGHISTNGAGPWKFVLMVSNALPFGSPPDNTFNGNCECIGEVTTRGNQSFPAGPQVYDSKGSNFPSLQLDYRLLANTWLEFTQEIIVGDISTPNTEVKWWIDGNLVYDWTGGNLALDGDDHGYGIGQIQIETYTTQRDVFYQGSAAGSAWYDDVITSTQPIAFNNGGGGNPSPPSGTAGRIRIKKP